MNKRSRPKQRQGCRLPGGTRAPWLIYSKAGIPVGSQNIAQAEKRMREL